MLSSQTSEDLISERSHIGLKRQSNYFHLYGCILHANYTNEVLLTLKQFTLHQGQCILAVEQVCTCRSY